MYYVIDRFEFWRAVSYRQHDHSHHIFVNRFRGFGLLTSLDLAISTGLASRSYNSVSTTVRHCDIAGYCVQ